MAEERDASQKTEEPTQKRLDDARKKGQGAYSREVLNWLMMLAVAIIVMTLAPGAMGSLGNALRPFLERPHAMSLAAPDSVSGMGATAFAVLRPIAVPLGLLAAAAIAGNFVQRGVRFDAEQLKPKLENISLPQGVKRLFSMRAVVEFTKNLMKIVIVGVVAALTVMPELDSIERLISMSTIDTAHTLQQIVTRLLIGTLAALTAIAALDYFYQRLAFMKQMRMSREELKEEFRQTEGDPQIKLRIRQLRQERARRRMMAAVPTADVVITNPTHYAVALKYDEAVAMAPILVAKGADAVALRIRAVAKENEVPIIENPPLARALYALDLDAEIPGEHYRAVAEIIGYVWRLKGRMGKNSGRAPGAP
jgi:flagellar biosynthetic protein FlhB